MWVLWMFVMFENRVPPCSGPNPPQCPPYHPCPTQPKRPRYPPHHGWNQSQGPIGSQPKPPQPPQPKPTPKPKPPPHPQKETYAGAQNGRYPPQTGPGHHAHELPYQNQRP